MRTQLIGAHMPSDGGMAGAVRNGKEIGCTAVQVFTSSPRQWKSEMPSEEKIQTFKKAVADSGITSLISHDSYLINLADPDIERRKKSREGLKKELKRSSDFGIGLVVSHLGAHMGQGEEVGLQFVAESLHEILDESPDDVILLMETTAGQGTSLNWNFEHLTTILDLTKSPKRLGICIDTCHIFAAGYDIRTPETYSATFEKFDKTVGIDKVKAIHCNDSKKNFGSRVDRHEHLGDGAIGGEFFKMIMKDGRFDLIPKIVETPTENEGHRKNVMKLWNWAKS